MSAVCSNIFLTKICTEQIKPNVTVFLDFAPCNLAEAYQRFRDACSLYRRHENRKSQKLDPLYSFRLAFVIFRIEAGRRLKLLSLKNKIMFWIFSSLAWQWVCHQKAFRFAWVIQCASGPGMLLSPKLLRINKNCGTRICVVCSTLL
jgi:hypothetical protein